MAIHFLLTIALFVHLVACSGCKRATQSDLLITLNSLTVAGMWVGEQAVDYILYSSRYLDRHRLTFVSISG